MKPVTLGVERLLEWGVAGHAGEKTEQEEMGRGGPGETEAGGASEGAHLTVKGLPGGEQSEEAGAVRTEQESRKI